MFFSHISWKEGKFWFNTLLQGYLDSKNSEDAAPHFEEYNVFNMALDEVSVNGVTPEPNEII